MSVYVDWLQKSLPSKNWPYSHHCHLLADTEKELHEFALSIRMKRSWFQNKNRPHYDLTKGMRTVAIKNGAVEITDNKMWLRIFRKQRIIK